MLILNPLKPFYIDKKNKIIRMGNFKNAAKEIEYEDESFIQLFEYKIVSHMKFADNFVGYIPRCLRRPTNYDRLVL